MIKYYLMLVSKEMLCFCMSMPSTVANNNYLLTLMMCMVGSGMLIYGIQLVPRGKYPLIDSTRKYLDQLSDYIRVDRFCKWFESTEEFSMNPRSDLFDDNEEEEVEKKLMEQPVKQPPFGVINMPEASHGPSTPRSHQHEHDAMRSSSGNLKTSSSGELTSGKVKKHVGFRTEKGTILPVLERDDASDATNVDRMSGQMMRRAGGTSSQGVASTASKVGTINPVKISSQSKINRS
jgi:hypothetical protein